PGPSRSTSPTSRPARRSRYWSASGAPGCCCPTSSRCSTTPPSRATPPCTSARIRSRACRPTTSTIAPSHSTPRRNCNHDPRPSLRPPVLARRSCGFLRNGARAPDSGVRSAELLGDDAGFCLAARRGLRDHLRRHYGRVRGPLLLLKRRVGVVWRVRRWLRRRRGRLVLHVRRLLDPDGRLGRLARRRQRGRLIASHP